MLMDELNQDVPSRMAINDNKAGMEGLDKERINNIILEASKGSRFYENEMKKDAQVNKKIDQLRKLLARTSPTELELSSSEADAAISSLEGSRDLSRLIVHIDMDAFYAAVEIRDNPKLGTVPMAVGGQSMLSTSNYLARRYGVRAAMPGFIGKKLCPDLVIVPPNFAKYKATSRVVRAVLRQYDADVDMAGLDEAYVDLTEHVFERQSSSTERRTFPAAPSDHVIDPVVANSDDSSGSETDEAEGSGNANDSAPCAIGNVSSSRSQLSASENVLGCGEGLTDNSLSNARQPCDEGRSGVVDGSIDGSTVSFGLDVSEAVREIRHRIWLATKVTASAGIAANRLLAKVCSDRNKPNGQFCLPHDKDTILDFISKLPVRKICGIGKVTEKILAAFGIVTCGELLTKRAELRRLFSDAAFDYFMSVGLGIGSSWVGPSDEGPKSKSVERTFSEISVPSRLYEMCHKLCVELSRDLKRASLKGRTVTLKIKTVKFEVKTRARTVEIPTDDEEKIYGIASSLLKTEIKHCVPQLLRLRLMGVRMSHFCEPDPLRQLSMSQLMRSKSHNSRMDKITVDELTVPPAFEDEPAQCEDSSSCAELPLPPLSPLHQALVDGEVDNVGHTDVSCNPGTDSPAAGVLARGAARAVENNQLSLPVEYQQLQDMVCPVCGLQCPGDLQRLNAHVDVCLRKQELQNLIQSSSQKKRGQTTDNGTSTTHKKKAAVSRPCGRDITSFFSRDKTS